jgi:hypothetical protein
MENNSVFFDKVRPLFAGKKLSRNQVLGMMSIIDTWHSIDTDSDKYLAYMLATVFHETAQTMMPIKEFGLGAKHLYGKKDKVTGEAYYGRGYVQITWKQNYKKIGDILGVDLVSEPDLALDTEIASKIMVIGMTKGIFTGKKLSDYFSPSKEDWINARYIINGKRKKTDKYADKAIEIAAYAKVFWAALREAYGSSREVNETPSYLDSIARLEAKNIVEVCNILQGRYTDKAMKNSISAILDCKTITYASAKELIQEICNS